MLRAIGAKISAQFFLIARFRDVVSGSSSLTNLSLWIQRNVRMWAHVAMGFSLFDVIDNREVPLQDCKKKALVYSEFVKTL